MTVFVGSCRPHWQFLSCEKKGTKDSQGTFWFLDLQQKGEFPFDPPGQVTVKAGGANQNNAPSP